MKRLISILMLVTLFVMASCYSTENRRDENNDELAERGGRAAEVEQDHDISVEEDLMATIENIDMLERLHEAARASKVFDKLDKSEEYTLLAPANIAFDKAKSDEIGDVPDDWTTEDIEQVLSAHIIRGSYNSTHLVETKNLVAINGEPIGAIQKEQLLQTDLEASNGIIHVIDTLLVSPQ